MFLPVPLAKKAAKRTNLAANLGPPTGALNAISAITAMPPSDCVVLENWFPYQDRLQMRPGAADHVTGFANTVYRLHNYSSLTGVESLWATTDAGVYNATTAGAAPAASTSLTNGKTIGSILSTGANNYLTLVNGSDDAKQYDGATWTSIAAFGGQAANTLNYVETYRQRYYFIVKNSMQLFYLAANAATGAGTLYNTAAIFRRGGYLVALGTWTIDGGTGPDDHLVLVSSMGELAVFVGNDPASWTYKGTYYIAKPLGQKPLFKYGGDLLYLSETGLYPLSRALLTATIDRTTSLTAKINQIFIDAGGLYAAQHGWEVISQPNTPMLLVNVPGTSLRYQYCMNPQNGSWTIFSGWEAQCWGRLGSTLYFGVGTKVAAVGGVSDFGANITATMLQAYSIFGYPRNKKIQEIRPFFQANGNFSYIIAVSSDFQDFAQSNTVPGATGGAAALWGTGVWGTSLWSGSIQTTISWRAVPDIYSTWKGLYIQVVSNSVTLSYLGSDLLVTQGSSF